MSSVTELHNKVKTATAEIKSIDASQLKNQEIVITTVVAFNAASLLVVQTLVLEAEVVEEETAWYIAADNTRLMSYPQFGTGAGTARPARTARPAKQTAAEAAPAAAAPAAAAETKAPVAESKPAAETKPVESAPATDAKVGEVKLTHVKPAGRGKKTEAAKETAAAAAPKATAAASKPAVAAPAAAAAPAKPAAPKTWATVAATSKPAEESSSAPSSSSPAAAAPAKEASPVVAPAAAAAPAKAAAAPAKKAATEAAGEVTLFIRTRSAVKKDAITAKLGEFATIKDLEVGSDGQKVIATFTTTDESAAFCTRVNNALPFSVDKAEVFSAEVSRNTPESLRRSVNRPAKAAGAASTSSPATGSRGPRNGPRSASPATKKE